MPAVHIPNVPDEVLNALKRRAARHERSLQKELRHILSSVAVEDRSSTPLTPISLNLAKSAPNATWRREEIYGDDGR